MPIEIKANVQGGMKSLWIFMRDKDLSNAVRVSLENFGSLVYTDSTAPDSSPKSRNVRICPLYALSTLNSIISKMFK